MTAIPDAPVGRGRLKWRLYRRRYDDPDPPRRVSWQVHAVRWLVILHPLGWVNAKSRAEAMEKARSKWPDERRLMVSRKMDWQ